MERIQLLLEFPETDQPFAPDARKKLRQEAIDRLREFFHTQNVVVQIEESDDPDVVSADNSEQCDWHDDD